MQLFHNKNGDLAAIERDSFKLEKDIQALVEANLETIFGLQFVSTEFACGQFRLDTLAFDEQSNAFVIIEYKRGHSYSVVDQGYSYLSLMLNNKAEFILEYNESTGKHLKRSDIEWSSSRVLFVAPSFNSYQKNSINFGDVPFELWEIRRFEGGLIALEQHQSTSEESIQSLAKPGGDSKIKEVSSEVSVVSESDHVSKLGQGTKTVWTAFKERLAEYADTNFASTKGYISWKRESTAVCFIHFRKSELYIEILRGNIKDNGERSKGFFDIDDPKNQLTERSWQWKSGAVGNVYVLKLKDVAELDYAMFLLDQKYKSLG